jgi:hypothetical protein
LARALRLAAHALEKAPVSVVLLLVARSVLASEDAPGLVVS